MAIRTRFDVNKFFISLLLIFIVIQVGSWILAEYDIIDIKVLKGGWILFLFLAVTAIITIYIIGKRIGTLTKQDIFFVIVVFLAIVGLFYYIPKYIPQIFSTQSLQISEIIKNTIHSVMGEWGGTIGNTQLNFK